LKRFLTIGFVLSAELKKVSLNPWSHKGYL
jgi:hypothetical protein